MANADLQACDFCGIEEMSNTEIRAEATTEYLDGPPHAWVPTIVLCRDCAQEVSDYLEGRAGKSDVISPFTEEDAQALLDRLVENEDLVLELGRTSGYGIHAVGDEFEYAFVQEPIPETIKTLTRREVRDLILNARRLTIKRFDPSTWEWFERNQ